MVDLRRLWHVIASASDVIRLLRLAPYCPSRISSSLVSWSDAWHIFRWDGLLFYLEHLCDSVARRFHVVDLRLCGSLFGVLTIVRAPA